MRYFFLFLFLIGCANPCDQAEFHAGGLCIVPPEHGVEQFDPIMVEKTVTIVEEALYHHGYDYDLSVLMKDIGVSLTAVHTDSDVLDKPMYGNNLVGLMFNGHLYVAADRSCVGVYSILAHEVLHIIVSNRVMGRSNEENMNHSTPYVWSKWAKKHGVSTDDTIEGYASLNVSKLCLEVQ